MIEYEPGALAAEQVEIAVDACGLCHSDLSVIDNEWGNARYPVIPGHEVVGHISALGEQVRGLKVGQRVGLGWFSGSCMVCSACGAGDHHLCALNEATILGRQGGFADRVRAHWRWVTPLPDLLDTHSTGPLFCGGITVFSPLLEFAVKPTDRVGVVGIGGLGHLALKFMRAWGCEVIAFTSSPAKHEEALRLGAHHCVDSRDAKAVSKLRGSLDFILVTANVKLDWNAYLAALAARGRLHFVGAVLEPLALPAFGLIGGQKSVSGSPVGSPSNTALMLEFCARHQIAPEVERFPMHRINDAIERLRSGKARYRVVLEN
jgi:uncharacterized zinc-type alcohol dehydrogenase-like protein